MHRLALETALLLAFAIIAIGMRYVARPGAATQGFGLPPPEDRATSGWWLRLKGVRDIVSGLIVLSLAMWGAPREVGIVLLVAALVPLGDMLTVLAAAGSRRHALGIHGLTAVLMLLTALPLVGAS